VFPNRKSKIKNQKSRPGFSIPPHAAVTLQRYESSSPPGFSRCEQAWHDLNRPNPLENARSPGKIDFVTICTTRFQHCRPLDGTALRPAASGTFVETFVVPARFQLSVFSFQFFPSPAAL
jgi:hypothetical protein